MDFGGTRAVALAFCPVGNHRRPPSGLCAQYHDAILLARHALRFDPYREELVWHLLALLALDERRIDAIRYYDHWIGMRPA
jgi:two-component SAPR family response regulator